MNTVLKILGAIVLLVVIAVGIVAIIYMSKAPTAAPIQAIAPQSAQVASVPQHASDPPALPAVGAGCPTEAQFKELTGVTADIVRTEACLFHWRGDPLQIAATHPCPAGWSCTLGSNGQNYQYNGDDSLPPMQIFAGSWRLLSQYPADDPVQNSCNFVVKVQSEGQISDPKWTVAPGNFSCP